MIINQARVLRPWFASAGKVAVCSLLIGLLAGFSSLSANAGTPLGGIGANLELTDDGVILRDIIPDSPAARAGLEAGDVVTEVNGIPLGDLGVQEVVPLLRGPVGSPVMLMIAGEGIEQPTPVQVIRGDLTKFSSVKADGWRGPDVEALSRIQLPENPSKSQATEYVNQIAAASRSQTAVSFEDPQIAMLARVGAENLDVLLKAPATLSFYVAEVVAQYASDEDKRLILEALSGNVQLIRVVVEKGWIGDARSILIAGLRARPRYLPSQWIEAVASLRDPRTYDDLLAYLIHGQDRLRTYRALQDLPGINLSAALDKAWQSAKSACGTTDRTSLTPVALASGHLDALQFAVDSLQRARSDREWLPGDRQLILKHTNVRGNNAQIIQWFKQNKSRLVFDSATRQFRAPGMQ